MRLSSAIVAMVGLLVSVVGLPAQALDFDSELRKHEMQAQQIVDKNDLKWEAEDREKTNTTKEKQDREFQVVLLSKKDRHR
ncbi:MAG: hypothetical protein H6624_16515 [Bdellovibrionaceae bacterium]|nr:hypothetical protein [Bdellovibrionales bacterium]MCB9085950.1 hypothetical protein [Pseudobdellovibrionaceae bacterium]